MHQVDTGIGTNSQTALLDALANDPAVRARMEADAAAVLEEFGVEFDASDIPADVQLPAAEEIHQAMQADDGDDSVASLTMRWFIFFS